IQFFDGNEVTVVTEGRHSRRPCHASKNSSAPACVFGYRESLIVVGPGRRGPHRNWNPHRRRIWSGVPSAPVLLSLRVSVLLSTPGLRVPTTGLRAAAADLRARGSQLPATGSCPPTV